MTVVESACKTYQEKEMECLPATPSPLDGIHFYNGFSNEYIHWQDGCLEITAFIALESNLDGMTQSNVYLHTS